MSAGHTSSSAASRLVQNEKPNATRIHVATVIPNNGHNQSQFDAKRLVELVSIALLMPSTLIGDSKARFQRARIMGSETLKRHAP